MVKGPCCILDPKVVRNSRRKSLEKPIGPLMVYNARNMSRSKFSLIILNCHLAAKESHLVVKWLIEACKSSFVRRVFLLTAQHFDIA